MNRKKEQIQERWEFGKEYLYRRGRADSVIRLGSNLFAGEAFSACVSSSHLPYFIGISELKRLCFYKKSSGYFYFFPASGYRNYNSGSLNNSGTWGYGWTSTPNGSNAWNLNFNSGDAYTNNNNRGNGFPVRCVQASAPVFVLVKETFVFFLAAGLRGSSDGKLGWSGSWGGCWTSTLNGSSSAWLLAVAPGRVYLGPDHGGIGLPVRCVQASAAVFVFIIKDFKETPVFFFPASGYRNYDDGTLRVSGASGYGWTSASDGNGHGWYLDFWPTIARMYSNSCTYGFSVRCVQGSATVFAFTKYTFVFFPATGYHVYNSGRVSESGGYGGGWSSTPIGNHAWNLSFRSGGACVDYNVRTFGRSVRCVQASAAVWAVRKENIKQIRYRRESGKGILCRRGQADSVTRLGRKVFANEKLFVCAASSYLFWFIKLPVFKSLYFYKHSSGYFLFFPASGARLYSDGSLRYSGTSAIAWTSTVKDSNTAWYLDVNSSGAHVTTNFRAYGFPVRCVQASAAVFVFIKETFVFFPASGCRDYRIGNLLDSGSNGYGWSSTVSGDNACYLYFSLGAAYIGVWYRDYGRPVRCVQASAAVFAFTKETFVFFPAAGYRHYSNGNFYNLGTWGYWWTSTPENGGKAWRLHVESGSCRVVADWCSYGFPVRCVQASAAVWAVQKENIKQIRFRRESGKGILYRRGQADSVTRLGRKLSARHSFLPCAVPSYSILLIKIPILKCLYFYKYSSGYFLFFPASGFRNYSDAKLLGSGGEGDGWTSTPSGGGGSYLRFQSGIAHVSNSSRGYGFPVRCVQASAAVWAVRKENTKQIRYRRESGKASLCRRGRADSVTRLGSKLFAGNVCLPGAAPSHVLTLIRILFLTRSCFYKHSSGYSLFFPAAGIRNYSDGSLRNSGGEGDGWTSTPYNSENAYRFILNSGNANMSNTNRTYGFPVRCVQASAAVFAFIRKDIEETLFFFPASGFRNYGDGSLLIPGTGGFGWTSTSSGGDVWYFECRSSDARLFAGPHGYGFPVRCVQASATVFAFTKDTFVFFPTSGSRWYASGVIFGSGSNGFVWTSSLNGDAAWDVDLSSGGAYIGGSKRSTGLSVRCVQGSAAVWAVRKENVKQIRYRRESGKGILCRRGQADSVTRLGRKVFANEKLFVCAASSYLFALIQLPVFKSLYFYKHSSGYFLFFPATGFRFLDAKLYNVGTEGHGWTSTSSGGSAWHYGGSAGGGALAVHSREFGFPVRCVQASAAVFVYVGKDMEDTFVFFPAAGNRDFSGGYVKNSGVSGYAWTSMPDGGNACNFDFYAGWARVGGNLPSYGFSVRCVQASAAVFAFTKDTFCFFPASGYHDPDSGVFYASGTRGYGWSSTPSNSSHAVHLHFWSGGAFMGTFWCASGFPVRCVQGSAAVWAVRKENTKQIRYRRESGKGILCRRGQADSVTRLGRKLSVGHSLLPCAAPSYLFTLIKLPVFKSLYFYKHSSGYFLFFPVSGYRNYSDGNLGLLATNGCGWSSEPGGGNAWYLDFYSGNVRMLSRSRGNGFPVRCVQASAAVFAFTKDTFCFFPAAGYRHASAGYLSDSGAGGYEWTSVLGENSFPWRLVFHSGIAQMGVLDRTYGFSVRCVQASATVFAFSNNTFVFFPATGDRQFSVGSLDGSGSFGFGWTSTPDGSSNAWNFYFYSARVWMGSNHRGYGFPVRCVQGSAAVFVFANDTFVFFPASGNRNTSSGNLGNSGLSGYGWTSVPNGGNGWYLDVFPSNARVLDNVSGGFGFPVRCVQGSAIVWVLQKENVKQIRYRRESGKASLCRRGQADSVTRLGCKLSVGHSFLPCAAPSYPISLIKLPVFECLYFYKHFSGYFLFFPATGFHMFNSGVLSESGGYGGGWSSTPSGNNFAWNLSFRSGFACVDGNFASFGRSVRCVQASANVFVFVRRDFKDILFFFPASGFRNLSDGKLYNSGTSGYEWTSTPYNSSDAWRFYFSLGTAFMDYHSRANGRSVRCVQGSATVWAVRKENIKQIRYRRESGKGILCRRGQADSVTRLRRKLSARHSFLPCAVPSYSILLIKIPILKCLYFYKYSSGYFLFFPASGFRNYSDAKLLGSGGEGDGWTSTPSGGGGSYLRFQSGIAHVSNSSRGYGFPVRCVQASATVFTFVKETFVFFPAAGVREYTDGRLYNSGTEGDGWTSVPDGNNAFRLIFKSGYAYVTSVTRTYGFPVRCVQASAAVWIVSLENTEQIRYRREFGKARLCRRGRADSVTRLGRKLSAGNACLPGAAPSHVSTLIRILGFIRLCFYKHSSGYSLFFPATGFRTETDGSLAALGIAGRAWTLSPGTGNDAAWYLGLVAEGAYLGSGLRTVGRSVRCVQASAAVLAFTKETFVFFPAAGHRYDGDGKLYYSGVEGDAWTSVPDGGSAFRLMVKSGYAYVTSVIRTYGFPVRCVQASATVFAFAKDTLCFFPAAGYRFSSSGSLVALGTRGYGWGSDPYDGSRAWGLFLGAEGTNMYYDSRAYGFSVRCVQASAAVSAFIKDTFVFFPASGVRSFDAGILYNGGVEGCGWSSVPYDANLAYRFRLYSAKAFVGGADRDYGFPVRCVQASATVFTFVKETFVFFPAAGRRDSGNGSLGYSGRYGYGWASTPNGSYAYRLLFSSGDACVSYHNRADGFPVRCVQASATVFTFAKETFVFFPAAGYRSYIDGRLLGSGGEGDGWTSTSSGSGASYFRFLSDIVHVNNNARGNGFPVRCVQASAAVWVVRKENTKQIRFRRESGKASLCRRGRADSVTRLGRKLFASANRFVCVVPSYSISLIELPAFKCPYFYKHSSGYFLFFPASGHRSATTGELTVSGARGDVLSSTTSGATAWYLYFSSGAAYMSNYERVGGRSVRCVQASAAVFAFWGKFKSVSCFRRSVIKDTFAFFPASGYRHHGDGKLYLSGTNGYVWSSTLIGGKAYNLTFGSGGANMHPNENRGHGFSVRCVQASAIVFVCMVLLLKINTMENDTS